MPVLPAILAAAGALFEGPAENPYPVGLVVRVGGAAGRTHIGLQFEEPDEGVFTTYAEGSGPGLTAFASFGFAISRRVEVDLQCALGAAAVDLDLPGTGPWRTSARWYGAGGGLALHPFSPDALVTLTGLIAAVSPEGGGGNEEHTPSVGLSPILSALAGWEWPTGTGSATGFGVLGQWLFATDDADARFTTSQRFLGLAAFTRFTQ